MKHTMRRCRGWALEHSLKDCIGAGCWCEGRAMGSVLPGVALIPEPMETGAVGPVQREPQNVDRYGVESVCSGNDGIAGVRSKKEKLKVSEKRRIMQYRRTSADSAHNFNIATTIPNPLPASFPSFRCAQSHGPELRLRRFKNASYCQLERVVSWSE